LSKAKTLDGGKEKEHISAIPCSRQSSYYGRPIGQAITFLSGGFFYLLLSSIFFFFSSTILSRRRLDVYHTFHTWCGLSANLGCRSETCCTRLAKNTGRKNRQNFAIWAPSHNFVGQYLRN